MEQAIIPSLEQEATAKQNAKVEISLHGCQYTIGISKNVVRLLGLPSHVCLMVHADGSRIMIAPCEANDVMSFKVPEKLFTDHSCTFRLNSKQFVHSMMLANGMEPEMSYIVPGSYNEKQNVACFDLKEHRLYDQRRVQRQQ